MTAPVILSNATTNREERSDRTRPHRDVPSRPTTTMPETVKQPVTITLSNGEITVEPVDRDLFLGEQVAWTCKQLAWEVRFDQAGSNTPFTVDVFGPGLIPPPIIDPDTDPDTPPDEVPAELSGQFREDAEEGNYYYSVQVGAFGPLMARIKIFRRQRRNVTCNHNNISDVKGMLWRYQAVWLILRTTQPVTVNLRYDKRTKTLALPRTITLHL
ncbi:MAG: hypothetical protein U0Y68_12120 [Blastocatellia bacterium]